MCRKIKLNRIISLEIIIMELIIINCEVNKYSKCIKVVNYFLLILLDKCQLNQQLYHHLKQLNRMD